MKDKLLVLDKDGTLTKTKSGERFVKHTEDQMLLPFVKERLNEYRSDGWEFAIATNQGGVEFEHKTLESAMEETKIAMMLTGIKYAVMAPSYERNGIGVCVEIVKEISGLFFDEYIQDETQLYRKPNAGMLLHHKHCILEASTGSEILWKRCLYVGDRDEDQQAAHNAGFEFMWADKWRLSGSI